jgi:2-polyprenyl-3-methyl-5-hydroxy-6-metoxy-1,4-benzoquinol methylase
MVMNALSLGNINAIDAVVSFDVLEHMHDQETFISEIFNVLKLGGKLFISTPNANVSQSGIGYHSRELGNEEFKKLLQRYFYHIKVLGQDITVNRARQKAQWQRYIYAVDRSNLIIVEDDIDHVYGLLAICEKQ